MGIGARWGLGSRRNKTADAARVMAQHAQQMQVAIPPEIVSMSPLQVMLRAMSLEAAGEACRSHSGAKPSGEDDFVASFLAAIGYEPAPLPRIFRSRRRSTTRSTSLMS
jgi:hypothetical protein